MKFSLFRGTVISLHKVEKKLLDTEDPHAGDDAMVLKCPDSSDTVGEPEWKFKGKTLTNSNQYQISSKTLTVKRVALSDQGKSDSLKLY